MARAFVKGYHPDLEVNHKNFNVADNRAENLEWVTSTENIRWSVSQGRRRRIGNKGLLANHGKLTVSIAKAIYSLREQGHSQTTIARMLEISQQMVSATLRNDIIPKQLEELKTTGTITIGRTENGPRIRELVYEED